MLTRDRSKTLSKVFKALSDPFRIRLTLALAGEEACVCHLERLLGKRQAYISQQLMPLRQAGLLASRREGKFVFYRLKHPETLELVQQAAQLAGLSAQDLALAADANGCTCPHCVPDLIPLQTIGEAHANR